MRAGLRLGRAGTLGWGRGELGDIYLMDSAGTSQLVTVQKSGFPPSPPTSLQLWSTNCCGAAVLGSGTLFIGTGRVSL